MSLNENGNGNGYEFATFHCFKKLADRFQLILGAQKSLEKKQEEEPKAVQVEEKSLPIRKNKTNYVRKRKYH